VLAIPTLIFSTKIDSPTSNGKSSIELKLAPSETVTSLVELLNDTDEIGIPFELLIGIIVGILLFNDSVFLNIFTSSSPRLYLISTSVIL